MSKRRLAVLLSVSIAGCSTVIDFGPEPGTEGDPYNWQYNPELHGPDAPPRDPAQVRDTIRIAPAESDEASDGKAPAAVAEAPALPPAPPPPAKAPAPESEAMFNDAIRRAVATGDIDRALKLLEEAERLGSATARPTFIDAVNSPGT
jgi:hypothetical protein